jgi:hypothetical protein
LLLLLLLLLVLVADELLSHMACPACPDSATD